MNMDTYLEQNLNLADAGLLKSLAYIDGKWCGADDGEAFPVTNPATGAVIANVPDMGADETRAAIEAANAAWPAWRSKTAKERAAILRKLYFLMLENQEDLAQILTAECGKPITEGRGEIVYGASFIEWFGEEAKRAYGDVIPAPFNDRRIVVDKQPIGVCAAITPWNFPIAMVTRKVGPALAAGNSVVFNVHPGAARLSPELARLARGAFGQVVEHRLEARFRMLMSRGGDAKRNAATSTVSTSWSWWIVSRTRSIPVRTIMRSRSAISWTRRKTRRRLPREKA